MLLLNFSKEWIIGFRPKKSSHWPGAPSLTRGALGHWAPGGNFT